MSEFELTSPFGLTGDQPEAVERLVEGLHRGDHEQTLMGVTGSGKTFTMANVITRVQRPTLIISHNKTLAAQLYAEMKEFFPHNSVEYFVSYYDYYQPEAYIPRTDTYIEKESDINDEIDKLRHGATMALLTRCDVIIVASVSCIYGLGDPEEYYSFVAHLTRGEAYPLHQLLRQLVEMQYERNDYELTRSHFRLRGDTLEILPSYEENALRLEFWGDELSRIQKVDPLTGEVLADLEDVAIYPAKHFVTSRPRLEAAISGIKEELAERLEELRREGKLLEAARLEARTKYDLEMLQEVGYCPGIENYSRHLSGRLPGSPPWTLLDYFPRDYLMIVDESHMSIPQIRGMYHGDISRKKTLVDYGFRLPSALDNRPLKFNEFRERINQVIYVSATPGEYERRSSTQIVEQLIRPTGLLEPSVEVRPTRGQVDDLIGEINIRVKKGERCLVTTLTKKMAEELTDYLLEMGIKTHYLHSEIDTLERVEILRELRLGVYDVVVGVNLLREGLDLPEVSLVAILDADKEGYLRSTDTLIQTMGRAARHVEGHVIMYADKITSSMAAAMEETARRRVIQEEYNLRHGITPSGIRKAIRDITDRLKAATPAAAEPQDTPGSPTELRRLIKGLESQMKQAAKGLDFETAALLRDRIADLRLSLLYMQEEEELDKPSRKSQARKPSRPKTTRR